MSGATGEYPVAERDNGRVVRRRVRVTGRVQGVYYRDSCRQMALRLGVSGFVANRADGSVEGAFEGPEDAIAALVAWCRSGPPRAVVEDVQVSEEPLVGEVGFTIS